MTPDRINQARARCRQYRRRILEVSQRLTALHVAPAFSCLELIDCCYFELMRREEPAPDTFLMSKGHAPWRFIPSWKPGVMSRAEMDGICQSRSRFGGHPDKPIGI